MANPADESAEPPSDFQILCPLNGQFVDETKTLFQVRTPEESLGDETPPVKFLVDGFTGATLIRKDADGTVSYGIPYSLAVGPHTLSLTAEISPGVVVSRQSRFHILSITHQEELGKVAQAMSEAAAEYGFDPDLNELVLYKVTEYASMLIFHFRQIVDAIPVVGGGVNGYLDAGGENPGVIGHFFPKARDINTVPTITEEQAMATLLADVGRPPADSYAVLSIEPFDHGARLVWIVVWVDHDDSFLDPYENTRSMPRAERSSAKAHLLS